MWKLLFYSKNILLYLVVFICSFIGSLYIVYCYFLLYFAYSSYLFLLYLSYFLLYFCYIFLFFSLIYLTFLSHLFISLFYSHHNVVYRGKYSRLRIISLILCSNLKSFNPLILPRIACSMRNLAVTLYVSSFVLTFP